MDYRPTGTQRRLGQSAVPRRDDVRRLRQPRPRRLDPDHPPRARRRHQLHRHRRLLLGRRVGGDRRQGARRRPPRRRGARHEGRPAVRRGPATTAARRGAGSRRPSRARCAGSAPTGSTSTRSTASIPPSTSTRRSARCRTSSTRARSARSAPRRSPPRRSWRRQWVAERRGRERFRTEQPPYSILTRAIEYDVLPTCLRHGLGVLTYSPLAGGWLTGAYRKGQEIGGPVSPARRQRFAAAYDATSPANAAKLDAADALGALADEAGITLDPDGDRVRRPPPGRHLRDRRPAHARAPRVLPRRRRHRALRRRARPHRRDRARPASSARSGRSGAPARRDRSCRNEEERMVGGARRKRAASRRPIGTRSGAGTPRHGPARRPRLSPLSV